MVVGYTIPRILCEFLSPSGYCKLFKGQCLHSESFEHFIQCPQFKPNDKRVQIQHPPSYNYRWLIEVGADGEMFSSLDFEKEKESLLDDIAKKEWTEVR